MQEHNLSPKGQLRWNNPLAKFPFNNRGEVAAEPAPAEPVNPAPAEPAAGNELDWKSGFDPSIKDHPSLSDFKTPGDLAKSYVNVQPLIGKEKLPVPSKDSDPMAEGGNEEYNMVYDRLGRPASAEAYEIPQIESPEGFPAASEESVKSFKELSHKIGLLPHQVKALYQWQHGESTTAFNNNAQDVQGGLQKATVELQKEYGKAFESNLSSALGLIDKFGGAEVKSILDSSGLGNNPHMVRFMVNVAKNFGEDGNIRMGESQRSMLSPEEAKVEVQKLMSDRNGAYWNRPDAKGIKPFSDAEHKAMVKKVADMNEMAHPAARA